MSSKITMRHDDDGGIVQTHIRGGSSDYATVCGVAADGDCYSAVEITPTQKRITCIQCYCIWSQTRHIKSTDFAKAAVL